MLSPEPRPGTAVHGPRSGHEIERRFLLRALPTLTYQAVLEIRQFYTVWERTRSYAVRFRRSENLATGECQCWETHKLGGGVGVLETEYPVPLTLFETMQSYRLGYEIAKRRHVFARPDAGTWEVDVFEGAYTGLIVAERELTRADEVILVPAEFGPSLEVTQWRGFRNVALCVLGLADEHRERLRGWYGREIGAPT